MSGIMQVTLSYLGRTCWSWAFSQILAVGPPSTL